MFSLLSKGVHPWLVYYAPLGLIVVFGFRVSEGVHPRLMNYAPLELFESKAEAPKVRY